MKHLGLSNLMRYGLAGGIAVAALAITHPCTLPHFTSDSNFLEGAVLTAFALMLGTLIYSIHRALLYPTLYRLMIMGFSLTGHFRWDKGLLLPIRPATREYEMDVARWKRSKNTASLQAKLSEWASQIHFLYCAAWAVGLGVLLGNAFPNQALGSSPAPVALLSESTALTLTVVLGVTAVIHHYRYLYFERKIIDAEGGGPPRSGRSPGGGPSTED